jgi:hypothetical protein
VSSASGAILDVNGDGFADIAVGAVGTTGPGGIGPETGSVYVYLGASTGLVPGVTALSGPDGANGYFGYSVASAGDVNGDGYADLVVGAYMASSNTGRAYVYLGGPSGIATTPNASLTGPDGAGGYFGGSVASAGDVDGDGYSDVVIGAYGASTNTGRVYVFAGGPSGTSMTPATTLTGPDGINGRFGASVSSAGDVNGDGIADVVIGAFAATGGGRIYVYPGAIGGLATSPLSMIIGPSAGAGQFGSSVAGAGDVDGDGYSDVIVGAHYAGASQTGMAFVYAGGSGGLTNTPETSLTGPDGPFGYFGNSVATAGDTNGDGYADVVISAFGVASSAGRAYVFTGGVGGVASGSAVTLMGLDGASGYFGASVAGAGDMNGDGFADVVAGATGAMSFIGRAYYFYGAASGITGFPSSLVTGPGGGMFGGAVASARRKSEPGTEPGTVLRNPRIFRPHTSGSVATTQVS